MESEKCKKCKGNGSNRQGRCGTCAGSGHVYIKSVAGGVEITPAPKPAVRS